MNDSKRKIFTYENSKNRKTCIILEPWAEEYTIFPKEKIEFYSTSGEFTFFELVEDEENLVFYANGQCVVEIYKNGELLYPF